jgi:hypothetical protein
MWQDVHIRKEIGAAGWTKLVCHALFTKLVILEEVLTFDFEIVFPRHHVHETPGSTGRAIAAAHGVFTEGRHRDTEADGFAMTCACVCCRSRIREEDILMHDEQDMIWIGAFADGEVNVKSFRLPGPRVL